MKYIEKNPEPLELIEYKNTPGVCYETMASCPPVRDAVKKSLLEEQGYICCYCGSEVELSRNTILEHLLPKGKDEYRYLNLEYTNILASCDGGQQKRSERAENGRKRNKSYPSFCDDNKKNEVLPVHPLQVNCEDRFYFDEEGKIYPKTADKEAEETIRILNLKNPVLCNRRKEMIDFYKEINSTKTEFKNTYLNIMNRDANGKLIPFCFVVKSYIKKFEL